MKTRTHCVKNPSFSIPLRRLSPTPSSVLIPMEYRMKNPSDSIPDTFDTWAKTKAAYRFFSNAKTKPELILEPHEKTTIKRMKGECIILAVQDSTDIAYSSHKETEGLGYINDSENAKGYHYHPTLAGIFTLVFSLKAICILSISH